MTGAQYVENVLVSIMYIAITTFVWNVSIIPIFGLPGVSIFQMFLIVLFIGMIHRAITYDPRTRENGR